MSTPTRRRPAHVHRPAVVAAATVVLTGLVAGCTTTVKPPTMSTSAGSVVATTSVQPGPAAAEILDRAKRNATAATSGAFKGQLVQDGATILVDFKGMSDGSSSDVTIELGAQGKVRVISVSDEVFIQGDAAFWQSQGLPDAAATEGKYVRAPKAVPDLTDQLSLDQFLDKAFAAVTPDQLSDTVGSEQVAGVDTWVLTDDDGAEEGALYVSKDRFEVVRFTGAGSTPAELDFSRWNEDLGIAAPPASQVVATP